MEAFLEMTCKYTGFFELLNIVHVLFLNESFQKMGFPEIKEENAVGYCPTHNN